MRCTKPTLQRLCLTITLLEKHYSLLTLEGLVASFSSFSITRYKAKEIDVKVSKGPEGSRSLRLPDFKTIST